MMKGAGSMPTGLAVGDRRNRGWAGRLRDFICSSDADKDLGSIRM